MSDVKAMAQDQALAALYGEEWLDPTGVVWLSFGNFVWGYPDPRATGYWGA